MRDLVESIRARLGGLYDVASEPEVKHELGALLDEIDTKMETVSRLARHEAEYTYQTRRAALAGER